MPILQLLVALAPQIFSLVHTAEAVIPAAGSGSQKLDFVMGALNAILTEIPQVQSNVASILAAAKPMIETFVSVCNALGWHPKVEAMAVSFVGMQVPAPVSDGTATAAPGTTTAAVK